MVSYEPITGTIPGVTGYTVDELRAIWRTMQVGAYDDVPFVVKRLACMAVGLVNQLYARPVYPSTDGELVVIGPQCIADEPGGVINWRGVNYYRDPT